jgi:hypothetical protein
MEDQQQRIAASPVTDSIRGMNVSPESEHSRQFEGVDFCNLGCTNKARI